MQGYNFELVTGPMSCGKTEELLRRFRRAIIAKKKVKDYIESRNGLWLDAIKVKNAAQILSVVKEDDEIIAIDELQFFDEHIVKVISKLIDCGKKVIGTSLDLDFKARKRGFRLFVLEEN